MRYLVVGMALVCLAGAPAWADFRSGMEALKRRDFSAAFAAWEPLAKKGDSNAQVRLGELYFRGDGVAKDYEEALAWFRQAAWQENRSASITWASSTSTDWGCPWTCSSR